MDPFYLVRSPMCYHGNSRGPDCAQTKRDTLEEAQKLATDLATQTQKTQLVYEIRLVGRAAIAEATWIPEA